MVANHLIIFSKVDRIKCHKHGIKLNMSINTTTMLRQRQTDSRTNRTAAALADLRMKSKFKAFSKIDITFSLFFTFSPFHLFTSVFFSHAFRCLYVYSHKRVHVSDLVPLSYW